jgi:ankyrin repeat protein
VHEMKKLLTLLCFVLFSALLYSCAKNDKTIQWAEQDPLLRSRLRLNHVNINKIPKQVIIDQEMVYYTQAGDRKKVSYLLSHGGSANAAVGTWNILEYAVSSEHLKIVRLFLKKGADINAGDAEGETPLMLAKSMTILKFLIRRGAKVNLRDDSGNTAAMHLKPEEAKYLLAHGASMNVENKKGQSLLMVALKKNHSSFAKYLILHGAKTHTKDQFGRTPLMYAVRADMPDVELLLLQHGANPNAKDKIGRTVLMHAVLNNNVSSVKFLLNHGANVNAADHLGNTALMDAVSKPSDKLLQSDLTGGSSKDFAIYRHQMIKILIFHRANLYMKNKKEETALSIARKNGFIHSANLIHTAAAQR